MQKLECYRCSTEKERQSYVSEPLLHLSVILKKLEIYLIPVSNPHIDHVGVTSMTHAAEAKAKPFTCHKGKAWRQGWSLLVRVR
jgi:hypothetical protein